MRSDVAPSGAHTRGLHLTGICASVGLSLISPDDVATSREHVKVATYNLFCDTFQLGPIRPNIFVTRSNSAQNYKVAWA